MSEEMMTQPSAENAELTADKPSAIKTVKKVWNITTTVLVCLVVLLAFALVGVKLFGVQVYTVVSGSMEPKILTGSVIYVVDADVNTLEVGDIVTYRLVDDVLATHRIIEVKGEGSELCFLTKGDANQDDDGYISADRIIGKAVFSVPLLGRLITDIQQPPGVYYAVVAGAGLLLLMILPELLFDNKEESKESKKMKKSKKEGTQNEEE